MFEEFRQNTTRNVGICASQAGFHWRGLYRQHPLWCSDRVFIPRGVKCYDTAMVIIWPRLGARWEMWLPNHFVPVMWPATVVTGTIDITSDNSRRKPHSSSWHTTPTEAFSQNQQPATTGNAKEIVTFIRCYCVLKITLTTAGLSSWSSKTYHFIELGDTLTFVLKRNGKFGKIYKRNLRPLESQPYAKEIVTFIRCYCVLKRDRLYV